jgi:hypothetical protein
MTSNFIFSSEFDVMLGAICVALCWLVDYRSTGVLISGRFVAAVTANQDQFKALNLTLMDMGIMGL